MLPLPNVDFDPRNLQVLADWVELSALLEGVVSQGDASDFPKDSFIFELPRPGARKDDIFADEMMLSDGDARDRFAEALWGVLRHRTQILGDGYPFLVAESSIRRRGSSWKEHIGYTSMLIADLGRKYPNVRVRFNPTHGFHTMFERIVHAAVEASLAGACFHFAGRIERTEDQEYLINEKVHRLADALGVRVLADWHLTPSDNDLGVDVVGRWSFGDDGHGTLYLLVQCASGENWLDKKGEPSYMEWQRLLDWQAHILRTVAIPFRFDNPAVEHGRYAAHFDAVMLDRMRLCAVNFEPNLSPALKSDLEKWCGDRVAEFSIS